MATIAWTSLWKRPKSFTADRIAISVQSLEAQRRRSPELLISQAPPPWLQGHSRKSATRWQAKAPARADYDFDDKLAGVHSHRLRQSDDNRQDGE
jgi:hypothetical protein